MNIARQMCRELNRQIEVSGYRKSEGGGWTPIRRRPENPENLDRFAIPEDRPSLVDANAMRNGTAREIYSSFFYLSNTYLTRPLDNPPLSILGLT